MKRSLARGEPSLRRKWQRTPEESGWGAESLGNLQGRAQWRAGFFSVTRARPSQTRLHVVRALQSQQGWPTTPTPARHSSRAMVVGTAAEALCCARALPAFHAHRILKYHMSSCLCCGIAFLRTWAWYRGWYVDVRACMHDRARDTRVKAGGMTCGHPHGSCSCNSFGGE